MAVSTELRTILDTGDEKLRTLLAELEQTVDSLLNRLSQDQLAQDSPSPDNKRREPTKVEPIKTTVKGAEVVRVLP